MPKVLVDGLGTDTVVRISVLTIVVSKFGITGNQFGLLAVWIMERGVDGWISRVLLPVSGSSVYMFSYPKARSRDEVNVSKGNVILHPIL